MVIEMNIENMIKDNLGIDTDQDIWVSAIKKFKVDTGESLDTLNCIGICSCKISTRTSNGDEVVRGVSGCAAATDKGLVVLGAEKGKFPVTLFIKKNNIRVLQFSSKLLSATGTVTTDSSVIEMVVPKKSASKLEVILNKARNP